MSTNNPFAGGPDFVKSLINAIEAVPNAYARPPQAGGSATSVRLPGERVACLDAIATASGWTRNEVVNALLDKGLFVLFHEMKDVHVEQIMSHAVQQIFPPTHGVSNMESYNGHKIAANAKQKPTGRWYSIFQYSINDNQMLATSEQWEPDFATADEAIEYGKTQAMETVDRNVPWQIFVKLPLPGAPLGNGIIPGNTVVPPLSASSEEMAIARCRDFIHAGYNADSLQVTGPNNIYWDGEEIRRRLGGGFPRQVNVEAPKPKKRQ